MNESSISHNRRSRRSPVLLAASIDVSGVSHQVKLRNLSKDGALIEGDCLPVEGSSTLFRRNDLCVNASVAWVEGRFAGIAFERHLDKDEVLRNVPRPRARIQPEFRRPGLACRPLTADERRMVEQWVAAAPVPRPGD